MHIQEYFTASSNDTGSDSTGSNSADLNSTNLNHIEQFSFSREQASNFAKFVANDFNPIHDVDAKRFCVPGDLLFAISLAKTGLSQSMKVDFTDMVTDGIELSLQNVAEGQVQLQAENGKTYLKLSSSGEHSQNSELISRLSESYVAYSGLTFPHILVPLMREQNVMINPARPLVIYEGAELELDRLDVSDAKLVGAQSSLSVDGKRGAITLGFDIVSDNIKIGQGEKRMVLSGLREFNEQAMSEVVEYYNNRQKELGKS